MPKMKSKRSAAKKFSLTGTGKVKYKKMNLRHILTMKTTKRNFFVKACTLSTYRNELCHTCAYIVQKEREIV